MHKPGQTYTSASWNLFWCLNQDQEWSYASMNNGYARDKATATTQAKEESTLYIIKV